MKSKNFRFRFNLTKRIGTGFLRCKRGNWLIQQRIEWYGHRNHYGGMIYCLFPYIYSVHIGRGTKIRL